MLAISATLITAKNLALELEKLTGVNIPVHTRYEGENKILIRYGNAGGNPQIDTEFNSKNFIEICTDKLLFSKILSDAGIFTPIYKQNLEDLKIPAIIRTSLTSTGGKGIIICDSEEKFIKNWQDDYYWTEFILMDFELRVHVLGGKIKKIFKKVWLHDENEHKFPIRNIKNGYHYSVKNPENYPKLDKIVTQLTEIFGENSFYGLDIGYTKDRGYCIIEANSAPNLNSETVKLYANYLTEKLELGK